jgi:protein-S-isoprenylcysteine O-methyltransferase Ste14
MPESLRHWLPVIAALIIFAERMREVFAKRQTVAGKTQEKLTFNLFMLCGLAMVGGGIAEYLLFGGWWWWPALVIGVSISVASFMVRRAAIRALGRFWSVHVEMREGHEFVKDGPFAYARHPVYFSMILELLGTALVLNAWVTFGGVLLVFVPTLLARVRIEEKALVEKFGEAYRAYMASTPAIVPGCGGRSEP